MIQKTILVVIMLLTLSSCTRFKELHFFKDEAGYPDNYFKVVIKGHTFLTSSRYMSGYFDKEAVEQYFSELSQPEKGKFTNSSTSDSSHSQDLRPLSDEFEDKKLVLLLSSNSDEIATQIGAVAENQRTMDALFQLVNRDRLIDASQAQSDLTVQQARGNILASLGDELISGLDSSSTQTEVHASLLQYVNAIAAELGNMRPFVTLEEAHAWLNNNRAQLINR